MIEQQTPVIVRARVLVDQQYRRPDRTWLRQDDVLELDMTNEADAQLARFLESRSPAAIEVLEGEIPAEPVSEPAPASPPDDPEITALARRGSPAIRKALLVIEERRQRRREALAIAESELRSARAALRDVEVGRELEGKASPGQLAKAEAMVSERERNVRAKRAALEVETERTEPDREQLAAALPIAERLEAAAAVDGLRADFNGVWRKLLHAVVELANLERDVAEAQRRHTAAAEKIGRGGRLSILVDLGAEGRLREMRDHIANRGIELRRDASGRWSVRNG